MHEEGRTYGNMLVESCMSDVLNFLVAEDADPWGGPTLSGHGQGAGGASEGDLGCDMMGTRHNSVDSDEGLGMSMAKTLRSQDSGSSKRVVSHSTVEKQRRDRINSLIDQLRDLVTPTQSPATSPLDATAQAAAAKRPKHAVLLDTIRLVKQLQSQTALQQSQLYKLQSQLESAKACAAAASPRELHSCSSSSDIQLPSIHPAASAAVGIMVEEGPSCFYVKVSCKDRRGLLQDIATAIQDLNMEIRRAAISTSPAGSVYDVFEVAPKPDASVSDLELQCRLQAVLYSHRNNLSLAGLGSKRPRHNCKTEDTDHDADPSSDSGC